MNPLAYLKLGGGLLGLIALASAGWLIKDRFHQKALADDARACSGAAAAPGDDAPLIRCLAAVKAEIIEARRARLCETTLLPSLRPETRFAMQQSCGAGVKRLVAEGDAAASARDDLAAQLSAARTETTAAVTRAELRAARQHEREDHGRSVIEKAPRDAAGSITCDADCLRRLSL